MPRAIWNGAVVAGSDQCVVVENNQYFSPDAVHRRYLRESATRAVGPWPRSA